MSMLVAIHIKNLRDGQNSEPAPDRLLEGAPVFTTWEQDTYGSSVRSGVWASTKGKQIARKEGVYELCHILEGVVEVQESGGEPRRFTAGDTLVMKPGFEGTWKTISPVRKIYAIFDTRAVNP